MFRELTSTPFVFVTSHCTADTGQVSFHDIPVGIHNNFFRQRNFKTDFLRTNFDGVVLKSIDFYCFIVVSTSFGNFVCLQFTDNRYDYGTASFVGLNFCEERRDNRLSVFSFDHTSFDDTRNQIDNVSCHNCFFDAERFIARLFVHTSNNVFENIIFSQRFLHFFRGPTSFLTGFSHFSALFFKRINKFFHFDFHYILKLLLFL